MKQLLHDECILLLGAVERQVYSALCLRHSCGHKAVELYLPGFFREPLIF
jgi:hypothetical protein